MVLPNKQMSQLAILSSLLLLTITKSYASNSDIEERIFGIHCPSMKLERDSNFFEKFGFNPEKLFNEIEEAGPFLNVLFPILMIVLKALSCLGCLITFSLLHFSKLPSTPRLSIQKQRALTIFLFYFFYLVDSHVIGVPCSLCVFCGILSHFFGLSSFTWTLMEGILLYNSIVRKQPLNVDSQYRSMFQGVFCYGTALIIVTLTLIALQIGFIDDLQPSPRDYCWFTEQIYVFGHVFPVAIIMCFNVTILFAVLYAMNNRIPSISAGSSSSISSISGSSERGKKKTCKSKYWSGILRHVRILIILSFLLGLNGGLTIVKLLDPNWIIYLITSALCSSSGIFFFVHSVLLNKGLMAKIRRKLGARALKNRIWGVIQTNSGERSTKH